MTERATKITLLSVAALTAVAAMLSLALRPAEGSHTAGIFYTVEQGGVQQIVTPQAGTQDVASFYDYGSLPAPSQASANTGLEKSDTSILFLYEDNVGDVSLVMIHDKPADGSGGKVQFGFSGVPAATSFVVRDDSAGAEAVLPSSTWRWNNANTDGGALSGGLNGEFMITIDPHFPPTGGLQPGQITQWEYLDGPSVGNTSVVSLDPTKPATIKAQRLNDIDIKPGSDPNSIKLGKKGVIPVAILTTDDFDATSVDPGTVCFAGDCTEAHGTGHQEDVDGDGTIDLVLHFETSETNIAAGDTQACLTGSTFGGMAVKGCDSVRTR